MTMFKVKRGLEAELPVEKSNGTLYFCTDTGNIYIDMGDQRKQISAEKALLDAEGRNIIETYATKAEATTQVDDDGEGNVILTNVAIEDGLIAQETDPTVPQWAKTPTKPTYTAKEVGAVSNEIFETTIAGLETNYNESIIALSVDGRTVTYVKGDGSTHTFETQDNDTTYSLGTDKVTGLTKLYATTGNAEDGTMTQKAIKTELDKKVGVNIDSTTNTLIFTV